MSDRFSATYFESATEITDDHFGIVLKSSAVPELISGTRDWSVLAETILESGATFIRFPGGTEGWRDFDFTNQSDLENLKAVIDFCAEMNLSLQFTVSLRQFFVEPLDSDADGALVMSDQQKKALENFIERDLLDYAESKGVTVSNIQLDNEPLHRDLNGEFLNHREYGYLANTYAEIIGPVIHHHSQSPSLSIVTASGEGRFNSFGEISYGGAWGVRPIINGFFGGGGAQYIDSIDLHMGDVTLHPEYEDIFGTDANSASYLGASLYDGLNWQMGIWNRDTVFVGSKFGSLDFQVSAWSLPQAIDGGGALQNAMLAVLQIHSYSAAGIVSATNYTLVGGDANALFSFDGNPRAGGLIFGMMADSLDGLTAIKLEPSVSNIERVTSESLIEGFVGQETMVVYVANRTGSIQTLTLDFNDLTDEVRQFGNGISSISGRILGLVGDGDPANPYAEAIISDWVLESTNFNGMTAEFTLGPYEIIEFTIEVNTLDFVDVSGVLNIVDQPASSADVGADLGLSASAGISGSIFEATYIYEISFLSTSMGITVWSGRDLVEIGHDLVDISGAKKIQGTIFDDRMIFEDDGASFYGEGGNDVFECRYVTNVYASGGAGNDTFLFYSSFEAHVSGGGGDDSFLIFGSGSDSALPGQNRVIFDFSDGDGHDRIQGFDPLEDQIIFRGIDKEDVSVRYDSGDLVLSIGADSSLTLINVDASLSIDSFAFV